MTAMAETATEYISIAAPPERVWEIAADVERYPEWAKDIKDVVVRSRDEEQRPKEVEFRASALGRSTHYTLSYDYSEAPTALSWKMVKGDIERAIDGAYHFRPDGEGGTYVKYDLVIELATPLPGFVKRRAEVRILNTIRELEGPRRGLSARERRLERGYRLGVDVGGTKCLGVVIDDAGEIVVSDRRPTPQGGEQLVATVVELATTLGAQVPAVRERRCRAARIDHRRRRADVVAAPARRRQLRCRRPAQRAARAERQGDERRLVRCTRRMAGRCWARRRQPDHDHTRYRHRRRRDRRRPPAPRRPWLPRRVRPHDDRSRRPALPVRQARLLGALRVRLGDRPRSQAPGRQRAGSKPSSSPLPDAVDAITAEHIVAAAIDGDADAADVLGHFARWMAVGLGSLTMAFDPAMFVIGGGLSRAAPVYEDVLRQRFAEAVYASNLRPLPVLSFAVLGDRAGAVGAAFYGA